MIQDLLGAIASMAAYRRFATQKGSRTFFYLCFLSFLFTTTVAIALRLRVAPSIDETFRWLESSMPALTFSKGRVLSAAPEPVRLAHPQAPEIALMIDTSRAEPVTAQGMEEAKVFFYLTSNALYVQQRPGELRSYDLSKGTLERPVVVDAAFFRDAARALKLVIYPIAVIVIFGLFALSTAFAALIYALLGLIFNSLAGGQLGFGALYQIGVHAQSASTLLRIVFAFLPIGLPLVGLGLALTSAVYTWLGVRANAERTPQAPAA